MREEQHEPGPFIWLELWKNDTPGGEDDLGNFVNQHDEDDDGGLGLTD